MDVIQLARQLGKAIQEDERWVKLQLLQQRNERDETLQAMISEFEQRRFALNEEIQKSDRDQNRIMELDSEVRAIYSKIFKTDRMIDFNHAREDVNAMLQFVNQIISGSAEGRDPDSISYDDNCGGSCDGCSGCG